MKGRMPEIDKPDERGTQLRPRRPRPSGFRFGRRPISVDLLSSIVGIEFEEAWEDCVDVDVGDVKMRVIGVQSLRKNKRAAGRLRDLADVEALDALAPGSGES